VKEVYLIGNTGHAFTPGKAGRILPGKDGQLREKEKKRWKKEFREKQVY
jgi:hypothetical protein